LVQEFYKTERARDKIIQRRWLPHCF